MPATDPPGSGAVPILEGIQWQTGRDNEIEAYHVFEPDQDGKIKKRYIGRIGVRLQRKLASEPESKIIEFVEAFIAQKRSEKGIT